MIACLDLSMLLLGAAVGIALALLVVVLVSK
jgi:hypothetical protein